MRSATLLALAACLLLSSAALAAPRHPLDPLSWQEYWTALEVLRGEGRLDEETRFSLVNLAQPAKSAVLAWSDGNDLPRSAFAVVRQGKSSYEATIDLVGRKVTSWSELRGEQPNWLGEEFAALAGKVKEHPDFVAALKRRGIADATFIDCAIVPPGYYDTKEMRGKRLGHATCHDPRGVRNTWGRGIPGLTAVVDLHAEEVVRVVDEGDAAFPHVSADFDRSSIGPVREVPSPMQVEQPLGHGFRRAGHVVEWQKWRFHVRPDQRVGTIISLVSYTDDGRRRPVLYQGNLSEIFVPYMDPSFAWFHRNFIDAGEFSVGGLLKPLMPGLDCPDRSLYFDALVAGDNGRPKTRQKSICLFEREAGDPAWRHHDDNDPSSRSKRDLVVRSAAVLGNYDYVFDWVFQQNGSIEVRIGATGIAEAKLVAQRDALEAAAAALGGDAVSRADAHGRFVQPHVIAVNHDHYFSFRLDLDVDGVDNTLVVDRLVQKELPRDHPRRSLWVVEPSTVRTEQQGQLDIDLGRPSLWRIVSSERTNHVGYPTSYQILPGKTGATLLSEDDSPRRRAGFIDHHLWVTPYERSEQYAAGSYPTLSTPGKGLPQWTRENRRVERTDIVLWHTVAMHHMVRAEDWPVMPVMWHSFEIRPFDFFDRNPALDLP